MREKNLKTALECGSAKRCSLPTLSKTTSWRPASVFHIGGPLAYIRSTPFDFVVGLYSISSFADFMNKRAEPLNSSFYFMDADGIKTQTI